MSDGNSVSFLVGSLITSFVGAVLLIVDDFAGWYNYSYYVQSWGWIALDLNSPLAVVLIAIVAGLLFYCAFISLQGLRLKGKMDKRTMKYGLMASVTAFAIVFLGAVAFVAVMLMDEPSEWWFGAGFYGGLIGSGMTASLFFLQNKSLTSSNKAQTTS
jgi:hypothetical protein